MQSQASIASKLFEDDGVSREGVGVSVSQSRGWKRIWGPPGEDEA